MKKKIILTLGIALMVSSNIVLATTYTQGGVSYAEITATQTSSTGPHREMKMDVNIYGNNFKSSNNSLYVELFKNQVGPDKNLYSRQIAIGSAHLNKYNVGEEQGAVYYIYLNPTGALKKGCDGEGRAQN